MKWAKIYKVTALYMSSLILMLPICFSDTLNLIYDSNGNLITGDGFYRQYNSLNQLYKVYNGSDADGNLLEEYIYHPVEERILIKRTYQDGNAIKNISYVSDDHVRVKNISGSFDFIYTKHEGHNIAELKPSGSKVFMHPDHLGSTTLITDSNGSVFERTSYTPYGVLLSGGGVSRYGYEGKEHADAVGSIPSENLAAYWSLESNTDDLVGNNHGTVTGATATDGAVEDGYSFDGTDDSIEIGTDLIDFNKNWTISFWATNQNQHTDTAGLVTKTDSGIYGIAKGVSFTTAENPDSVFVIISDGTNNEINDTSVGANYGWTHFAAKRSTDRIAIYINGSSVATLDVSALNDVNGSQSMFFGKGNNGNYNGKIDEVGIWDRALPDNEIEELYLYKSRYDDGVQDIDFHFRKYQPEWGVFTKPDTLIPNIFDPQSLNRYMFERGNPFKLVDENGHSPAAPIGSGGYGKTGKVDRIVFAKAVEARLDRLHWAQQDLRAELESEFYEKYGGEDKYYAYLNEKEYSVGPAGKKEQFNFEKAQRNRLIKSFNVVVNEKNRIVGFKYRSNYVIPASSIQGICRRMQEYGFSYNIVKTEAEKQVSRKRPHRSYNTMTITTQILINIIVKLHYDRLMKARSKNKEKNNEQSSGSE